VRRAVCGATHDRSDGRPHLSGLVMKISNQAFPLEDIDGKTVMKAPTCAQAY
jgi:hypothetical protein